ncbi:hypothetical protein RAS1_13310 [Phycisphaerae bacterium RAS1]|nr:hypothetical protein RAS1_13310 [Phycisphaerae bacterium RAS1]
MRTRAARFTASDAEIAVGHRGPTLQRSQSSFRAATVRERRHKNRLLTRAARTDTRVRTRAARFTASDAEIAVGHRGPTLQRSQSSFRAATVRERRHKNRLLTRAARTDTRVRTRAARFTASDAEIAVGHRGPTLQRSQSSFRAATVRERRHKNRLLTRAARTDTRLLTRAARLTASDAEIAVGRRGPTLHQRRKEPGAALQQLLRQACAPQPVQRDPPRASAVDLN